MNPITLSRPTTLVAALVAVSSAFAAGYLVRCARSCASKRAQPAPQSPQSPQPSQPVEALDPAAPTGVASAAGPGWAPASNAAIPFIGSIFRTRFALAESPLDGIEAVLLSSRPEECLDDCPISLRVIAGEAARATVGKMLASLAPNLHAVAAAAGLPPQLAEMFRQGEAALWSHERFGPADEKSRPLRALFIAMPRPEMDPLTFSVGLAVYDLPDVHFDRAVTTSMLHGGTGLFISRVESLGRGETRPRLLSGAVGFRTARDGDRPRALPTDASELGAVYGSLWGHFEGLPEQLAGLYLDKNGVVFAYGPDLRLHRLQAGPELARLVQALLLRA